MNLKSTFTILTTFTLFVIIGFALLPLLEVSLLPSRSQPSIKVEYRMSNTSGKVIDVEITTPLEGVLSTLSGLVKLKSKTGKGSGWSCHSSSRNTSPKTYCDDKYYHHFGLATLPLWQQYGQCIGAPIGSNHHRGV